MLARTSLMGKMKSLGTPFLSGWWDRERWVFAMQMGRFPNPWKKGRERCSLSTDVSLPYVSNLHSTRSPRLRSWHTADAGSYLFTGQKDGKKSHHHVLITWLKVSVIYFRELSLRKALLYVCLGESVAIFRQRRSSWQLAETISKDIDIRDSER